MDWQQHFDEKVTKLGDRKFLEQVGKTVNGEPISKEQFEMIVKSIADALLINKNDSVLDLCCGNGVITKQIGEYCRQVVAMDFSKSLIRVAKKYNSLENIEYLYGSILDPSELLRATKKRFSKVYMYEALQFFKESEFSGLFGLLEKVSTQNSLVYFGSVPDRKKIWNFYDTPERKTEYLKRKAEGREAIGTWWSKNFIENIARSNGWKVNFLNQDSTLHTAHYRFDLVFQKN